jgi:hypothetical protein
MAFYFMEWAKATFLFNFMKIKILGKKEQNHNPIQLDSS